MSTATSSILVVIVSVLLAITASLGSVFALDYFSESESSRLADNGPPLAMPFVLPEPEEGAGHGEVGMAELSARLEALEARIGQLERLPRTVPTQPAPSTGDPATDALVARIQALEARILGQVPEATAEAETVAEPPDDAGIVTVGALGSLIDMHLEDLERQEAERRREERARLMEQQRERMQEHLTQDNEARLQRLTDTLYLNNWQQERVRGLLNDRMEAQLAMYDPDLEDEQRREAWSHARDVQRSIDTQMQEILTPAQYTSYQESGLNNLNRPIAQTNGNQPNRANGRSMSSSR